MAFSSAKLLRYARVWHKNVAAVMFAFFFVVSVTAILLGWKDFFAGKVYHTELKQKTTKSFTEWLPLESLKHLAFAGLKSKVPVGPDNKPDRMDARIDK